MQDVLLGQISREAGRFLKMSNTARVTAVTAANIGIICHVSLLYALSRNHAESRHGTLLWGNRDPRLLEVLCNFS